MTVFVVAICTETFLSSHGFLYRKATFGCLVDYLEKHNVSDEYFEVAESFDIASFNCSGIVLGRNLSFYNDLDARLHCRYNITIDDCGELETCSSKHKNCSLDAKNLVPISKACEAVETCNTCVREKLLRTEYELVRFHATAVNYTVIEYQIWKYFSIAPRVAELSSQGKEFESEALKVCKNEDHCGESSKIC